MRLWRCMLIEGCASELPGGQRVYKKLFRGAYTCPSDRARRE